MLTKDNVKIINHISEDYQKAINEEFDEIMTELKREKKENNRNTAFVFLSASLIFFVLSAVMINSTLNEKDKLIILASGFTISFIMACVYNFCASRSRGRVYKPQVDYFYLRQINHATIKYIGTYLPTGEVKIVKKYQDQDMVYLSQIDNITGKEQNAKMMLTMFIYDSDRNELELYNDHVDAYLSKELQDSLIEKNSR